jgi:hypothetical protein
VVVAANSADAPREIIFTLPKIGNANLTDLLNPGESFPILACRCRLPLNACWGRILALNLT